MAEEVSVKRLDRDRVADFYKVHDEACGSGWCCCVAWWTPTWTGWGDRTAAENRALRDQLFDRGEYDGYLLYRGAEPIGWCQCGPRDRLEKLRQSFDLSPDPNVYAISCFLMAPDSRRQGLAHTLLQGVLDDLRRQGVRKVEAFPSRGRDLSPEDLWTGPEPLFVEARFALERDDPQRPIYRRTL